MKPPAAPDLPDELAPLEEEPPALRGAELSECVIAARDWAERDGTGLRLSECRLDGVDLSAATLRRASARDVGVHGGSWANADATESTLKRVEVRAARLTGVSFTNATLEDVLFTDCRLDLASFRFANLSYVRFDDCQMAETDFYEATITSSVFSHCVLARASLAGATFAETELRGCDLTAVGNAERLRGIRMPWADVARSADVLAAGLGIQIVE